MSITYLPGKEPHPRETRRILKNINREGWNTSIDCYLADGGYEELKKALGMEPKAVIDEVKKSGLRGRGGAGFPTGVKWTFIPPNNTKPVYLVCNCDESEPGTFKDRYIVHQDPHQLIEGMVISSYAVGAHLAYIYMREEFPIAAETMLKALGRRRANAASWARTSWGPATIWKSTCTAARAPTSAVRKRPCSTPWKACAPTPASSPPTFRPPSACTVAPPS